MEPVEASEKGNDPQEVIDLQDDHLMHRDEQEPQPEPEPSEEVLTNDIEKDPPPTRAKRPRSKAQQEAFKKQKGRSNMVDIRVDFMEHLHLLTDVDRLKTGDMQLLGAAAADDGDQAAAAFARAA